MKRHWILALLLASVSLPLEARVECRTELSADSFEAERVAAVKELLGGLESYAEWCTSKKNWVERNRVLESILTIDPSNMSAKRGLGWQQVADGVWEPPKEPKPAKNYDPSAMKEAPARFTEAIRPWRDHLTRLLEEHKGELTQVQRNSVYDEILSVDPDDAFVHAARVEVHGEKGWVLTETVRAKARRGEIKAIVKDALAGASKVADIEPNAEDLSFKVAWKFAVGTDRVRVLTTGDRPEAERAAHVLHATRDVFNKVFGTKTDLGSSFTAYLICDAVSKATFVANMTNVTPAERDFYQSAEGTGFNGGSNNEVWWSKSPEQRLDGVTRQAFGAMFRSEFKLTTNVAWAWEGLGLYLTREMIGTRLSWYYVLGQEGRSVAEKTAGDDWAKKIHTPGTNWMNEGYSLVRAADEESLSATLGRPLNQLTPQDLFLSYVVSAYLLEAEAARLPALLHALGGSKDKPALKAPQAWQNELSMDMEMFVAQLKRWLGERR